MTDAILQQDDRSVAGSMASTGRSWERVSETTALRQGPYTAAPKPMPAAASSSASSMAKPAAAALASSTLLTRFGPGRAEKISAYDETFVFINANMSGWITLLCFQMTVLFLFICGWCLYHYFPRPVAESFMYRVIRRCRAIPSLITYSLFDEMDQLRSRCEELEKEADKLLVQSNLDAKDRISWINVAQAQHQMLSAQDRQARELHAALVETWDSKCFWKLECYLATHFSDWERGVPEDDQIATRVDGSNVLDYYQHGCQPLLRNFKLLARIACLLSTAVSRMIIILQTLGAPATRHNHLYRVICAMDLLYRCTTKR